MPFEFMPINLWHGFGAFFLMAAVLLSGALRSFFSSRPVVYLGKISFALYLTHGLFVRLVEKPIFNFLTDHGVNSTVSLVCALAVFIPTALLIAHGFTILVEGRAMWWSEKTEAWVESLRVRRRHASTATTYSVPSGDGSVCPAPRVRRRPCACQPMTGASPV
jgi:peptidoglycan/LPS O-acetylase OafA/YrhL